MATKTATRLLTPAEAAHRLGCSDDHIYRLIAAGALDVVDIAQPGARRPKSRVPETSVDAFIARRIRNAKQLRAAG